MTSNLPMPALPLLILGGLILLAVVLAAVIPYPPVDLTKRKPVANTPTGRVWVIVNPTKPHDYDDFRTRVDRACLTRTGQAAQWIETTEEDPGTGQAIGALKHEPSLVLAAGGDGTVRAVAAAMVHSGVPMGILPMGTGNLLVRNLRLPLDLGSALEVALTGRDRPIDLAWIHLERIVSPPDLPAEGTLLQKADASSVRVLPRGVVEPRPDEYAYVVIAGLGFDGETMANTSSRLKKVVGWPAYVFSALTALRTERMKATVTIYFPPGQKPGPREPKRRPIPRKVSQAIVASQTIGDENSPVKAVHTEDSWEMSVLRARTVLFANCGELPFVLLAPDAVIDDGALDIVAIDTQGGLVGWINLALKVFSQSLGFRAFNTGHDMGQIAFQQTQKARVDTNRAFPVQVDGDAIGTARTVIARVDGQALLVRTPGEA